MAGQTKRRERRAFFLLIAVFCLLSAVWAFRAPIPGADGNQPPFNPDEAGQFAVVRYMATYAALPPYRFPYDTSVHPPLYHAAVALFYVLFQPLGNLARFFALRLLSCAIGAATVYQTFRTARYLGLQSRAALLSAAIVASVPMFVSLSGAISNENLAALGAAGTLATLAAGLRHRFDNRRILVLALWLTVGIGSKITCLGLIPVVFFALVWSGRRRGLPFVRIGFQFAMVSGFVLACLGWWFARNQMLYGDPFRKAAADALWNPLQPGFAQWHTSALHYAAALTLQGWRSFWGVFDAQRRGFPNRVYLALLLFQSAALVGLLLRFFKKHGRSRLFLPAVVLLTPFVVFVAAVYFQYNWAHYTPQGRYWFVLLAPFGIVTALGWLNLFPRRFQGRATAVLLAALLMMNLYAVWFYPVRPAVHDTITGL